jgi:hypothetical protein
MPEIRSSGLMSGDGKRGVGHRPQATAPILDSTASKRSRSVRCAPRAFAVCWSTAPTTNARTGSGSVPISGRTKRGCPSWRTSSPVRSAAVGPTSGPTSTGTRRSNCRRSLPLVQQQSYSLLSRTRIRAAGPWRIHLRIKVCCSLSTDQDLNLFKKLCPRRISPFTDPILATTFSIVMLPTFNDLIRNC